jgi:hypothetical protein
MFTVSDEREAVARLVTVTKEDICGTLEKLPQGQGAAQSLDLGRRAPVLDVCSYALPNTAS